MAFECHTVHPRPSACICGSNCLPCSGRHDSASQATLPTVLRRETASNLNRRCTQIHADTVRGVLSRPWSQRVSWRSPGAHASRTPLHLMCLRDSLCQPQAASAMQQHLRCMTRLALSGCAGGAPLPIGTLIGTGSRARCESRAARPVPPRHRGQNALTRRSRRPSGRGRLRPHRRSD